MGKIPLGLLVGLQHSSFNFGNHGPDFAFGDAAGRGCCDPVGIGDVAALIVDHCPVFAVVPGGDPSVADKPHQSVIYPLILNPPIVRSHTIC